MTATKPSRSTSPELIFAVVRPVGTPGSNFVDALAENLFSYGYDTQHIKLSSLLEDLRVAEDRSVGSGVERIYDLMDEGDKQCLDHDYPATIALLGVVEVQVLRSSSGEGTRRAYVLDSLKRPAEVTQLRAIYGDHLFVISLQASMKTREAELKTLIAPSAPSKKGTKWANEKVEEAIARDLRESDKYGQNVLRTFPMADVFINVDQDVKGQITRFMDLLFGNPDYKSPTAAEYGMSIAHLSSTRSPELGLKVGAALVTEEKRIVATGANAHPKEVGSPSYDASVIDIKALLIDTLQRLGPDFLRADVIGRLEAEPDALAGELISGSLAEAEVRGLTEFQLPVHAEMNALLDALRNRAHVEGATVYVTSFPCHTCAKHLIALNLQVRYIEPYPRSRASSMYGTVVDDLFAPFTGIAPRRFHQMFTVTEERKDPEGVRMKWGPDERKAAAPRVDPVVREGTVDREHAAVSMLEPSDVSCDTPRDPDAPTTV